MNKAKRIVVIGCSGVGALAARTLKRLEPSLEVAIIREQEEKGLLIRCATPYVASGNVMVEPSYKNDDIFLSQGIKLVNVKAVGIERKRKEVVTADGATFPYDKLVLAAGAKPIVFAVQGVDLPGVFTLRRSGDAVNILHWVNTTMVKDMVVIGAGAIGIEIAYLFSLHGMKITLVEIADHIMPNVLDPDMSEKVEGYLRENGVELKLKQKVKAIMGERGVGSVELSSGENIKAGMIIISGGARPNLDLARKAELEIGQMGLKVNEYLQTSDPDIYAAGDLIEYKSFVTGKPILGQLRPNAVIGGRVIARNLLGYGIKFPGFINNFATKFLDKTIAGAGLTESEAAKNGISVVAVRQDSVSQHSMMREKKPYTIKLIFNRETKKIIGGQIISDDECPMKHIDLIALAIRCGMTALDLMTFRCAGQPELSANPSIEPIAIAAGTAFETLYGRNRYLS